MEIHVNEHGGNVVASLVEPSDFKRFSVMSSAGSADSVAALLARAGIGRAADGDEVFVDVEAVRTLAGAARDAAWDEQFAGMLAYAGSKGWLDDAKASIRAHIG